MAYLFVGWGAGIYEELCYEYQSALLFTLPLALVLVLALAREN